MQNLAVAETSQNAVAHAAIETRHRLSPRMSSAVARPKDWTEQSIAPRVQPGRPHWLALANRLRELELTYDAEKRILWQYMMPDGRPSFTHGLISEISATLDLVENVCADAEDPPISYLVLGSHLPGIFNLGGNLPLFMELIERQDRDTLRRYAHACVNEQYRWAANHNLPVCTIALVQGDALGGGFEAALAHNVIIAERSAKFGLPEVLFNLFPGMGAYSFLSRRLDAARAERMILSGRIYSAEELYELGLVERIAEDGQGRDAVYDFIRERQRSRSAWQAVVGARRIVNPITRQELIDVTNLWVETAMTLSSADLRRMKHLATAQDRRLAKTWAD